MLRHITGYKTVHILFSLNVPSILSGRTEEKGRVLQILIKENRRPITGTQKHQLGRNMNYTKYYYLDSEIRIALCVAAHFFSKELQKLMTVSGRTEIRLGSDFGHFFVF